jgi:hypothetical protein
MCNKEVHLLVIRILGVPLFILQYVLSVLKFTYPTIFQGWQTLVCVLILKYLTLKKQLDVAVLDKSTAISLLPHCLYFLGAIVAGSKALATLVSIIKLDCYKLGEVQIKVHHTQNFF